MTRPLSEFEDFPALKEPVTQAPPVVSRSMSLPVHIEPNSFEAAQWRRARVIVEFGTLRPAQWPAFIAEIMLEPKRTGEICERYGTTPGDVRLLLEYNEQFQATRDDVAARLEKYGKDGKDGFEVRAKMYAEETLPELRDIAKDKGNIASSRVRAIEKIMDLADYGSTGKTGGGGGNGKVAQGATGGVTMNVSFGAGLPPIEALSAVQRDGDEEVHVQMNPIVTVQGENAPKRPKLNVPVIENDPDE